MPRSTILRFEYRVAKARERVEAETPASPAWDAAMAELEDAVQVLERCRARGRPTQRTRLIGA